jgi:CRISPR-associated Cas5-like protein
MKAIKLDVYQQQAHFREPKILNANLITTLPLPGPTTIVGMLTHLNGKRFNEIIDIGVLGKFDSVRTDFQRIEKSEWVESYGKELVKEFKKIPGSAAIPGNVHESISEYKKRKGLQGISTFEILCEGSLTIFIKTSADDTLERLYNALKEPFYYPSLGRKEDYAEIRGVGVVDLEENVSISQKEAIENGYILKNTYVPVNLKSTDAFFDALSEVGTLYVFPGIYSDIFAQKQERKYIHRHYIHIGDNSCYLAGTFNRYQKTIFKWLVQTQRTGE